MRIRKAILSFNLTSKLKANQMDRLPHLGVEKEKAYIHRQMQCLKTLTVEYPVGWYMGRISPYPKALIHEVHEELKTPLLWEADTYAEDLPYWVDVPAEKDSVEPKGMLMKPYRCVNPPEIPTPFLQQHEPTSSLRSH